VYKFHEGDIDLSEIGGPTVRDGGSSQIAGAGSTGSSLFSNECFFCAQFSFTSEAADRYRAEGDQSLKEYLNSHNRRCFKRPKKTFMSYLKDINDKTGQGKRHMYAGMHHPDPSKVNVIMYKVSKEGHVVSVAETADGWIDDWLPFTSSVVDFVLFGDDEPDDSPQDLRIPQFVDLQPFDVLLSAQRRPGSTYYCKNFFQTGEGVE